MVSRGPKYICSQKGSSQLRSAPTEAKGGLYILLRMITLFLKEAGFWGELFNPQFNKNHIFFRIVRFATLLHTHSVQSDPQLNR